ncbi:MAG: thermonuclease family protein [Anaerolineae bacterium]|nr:thermonuclease family protein [Anaerolineae bacterium]
MIDRTRNLSTVQKTALGLTAVLTTFCVMCCGCVGLIALLPSDENQAVAQVTSEIIEVETVSESVQRESASESAPEPGNTPPPPTNIPSIPTHSPEPTSTPRPTNTARPSPTLTSEPETGQTILVSGAEVAGDSATGESATGDFAAVTRIIDGDTIEVDINGQTYRVRYIGMDTPERGDPYFDEATEANRQLVEGQIVTLVKDVSETDRYGRLLRYLYLSDGTFINAELVKQSYALVATFPPDVRHQELFVQLQQEARDAGSGLWGQAVATLPPASQTPQPSPPSASNCDPS